MSRLFKKILYAMFTIFLAMTAIFFVIRLAPGDPVETILGQKATQEEILKVKEQLGLHLTLSEQYVQYLKGFFKGDLGMTLFGKKEVKELLKERMTPTIILAFVSVSLSAVIGMFLGIMAGFKKSQSFDKFSMASIIGNL